MFQNPLYKSLQMFLCVFWLITHNNKNYSVGISEYSEVNAPMSDLDIFNIPPLPLAYVLTPLPLPNQFFSTSPTPFSEGMLNYYRNR